MEGIVTKIAKDHVLVQIGGSTGRLAFDDMAWASKYLKGKDPNEGRCSGQESQAAADAGRCHRGWR